MPFCRTAAISHPVLQIYAYNNCLTSFSLTKMPIAMKKLKKCKIIRQKTTLFGLKRITANKSLTLGNLSMRDITLDFTDDLIPGAVQQVIDEG